MLTFFSRQKKFPISSTSTSLYIHRQNKTVKDWQWFSEPNKSTRRCEPLSILDVNGPSGSGPKLSPLVNAPTWMCGQQNFLKYVYHSSYGSENGSYIFEIRKIYFFPCKFKPHRLEVSTEV